MQKYHFAGLLDGWRGLLNFGLFNQIPLAYREKTLVGPSVPNQAVFLFSKASGYSCLNARAYPPPSAEVYFLAQNFHRFPTDHSG